MMVLTSLGELDESLLKRFEEITEDDNQVTKATGYTLNGAVVQRSVHVHLKKGLSIGSALESMGV